MFSVRIVSTDHYMATPIRGLDVTYADQRATEVKKVPVVRIFGSTPSGQKTCMHVHGVFPYLYVPYDGTVPWDRFLRQFATSLDKAINVALGYGQAPTQHVYKIVLVNGRAMYGYHDEEQQFLKIYLYNPGMVKKAADLLLGGAVLNKPFQPHEAHIPYTLQLFIDYNLYGMNLINVAAIKFRRNASDVQPVMGSQGSDEGVGSTPRTPVTFTGLLNRSGTMTPSQQVWDAENIPSEMYLDSQVERMSTCKLEVDAVAVDIINRLEIGDNVGNNPGLAALWEDERQRCRDRGEITDIAPPESQDRGSVPLSDSEIELRARLQQILLELQPYIDSQPNEESSSCESDLPLTQASEVDLHLSQDEMSGTQDIEDEADLEPVVDVPSIHRIVSASQSFCDIQLDTPKVPSQDRSLVDILASLADESSPPSSQNAAVVLGALEDKDSVLSQVSEPLSQEEARQELEESLEMTQRVWDGIDQGADLDEYDLAGLDDTWVDSQEAGPSNTTHPQPESANQEAGGSDSDSDMSDVIPQYDGANDEPGKAGGVKRMGMRGPASRTGAIEQQNSIAAVNPFGDVPETNMAAQFNAGNQNVLAHAGHQAMWNQSAGNQQWPGPRYRSQPGHQIPPRSNFDPRSQEGYQQMKAAMERQYMGQFEHQNRMPMGHQFPTSTASDNPYSQHGVRFMSPAMGGYPHQMEVHRQLSPRSFNQAHPGQFSASQGYGPTQPASPQFIATPLPQVSPTCSQMGDTTNMPSNVTSYQHMQVNRKLESAIRSKQAGQTIRGNIPAHYSPTSDDQFTNDFSQNAQQHNRNMAFQDIESLNQRSSQVKNSSGSMYENSDLNIYQRRDLTNQAIPYNATVPRIGGPLRLQTDANPSQQKVNQRSPGQGYCLQRPRLLDQQMVRGGVPSPEALSPVNRNSGNSGGKSSHSQQSEEIFFMRHVSANGDPPSRSSVVNTGRSRTPLGLQQSAISPPLNHLSPPQVHVSTEQPLGPVSRYYQARLAAEIASKEQAKAKRAAEESQKHTQYEAISPPATPVSLPVTSNALLTYHRSSVPSTPSPSSNTNQLSPLERLLFDPESDNPAKQAFRSVSQNSNASVSSLPGDNETNFGASLQRSSSVEKLGNSTNQHMSYKSPQSANMYSPGSQRKIENTKLYNLLSSNTSPGSSVKESLQQSANESQHDSQQDLFADLENSRSQRSYSQQNSQSSSNIRDDSLISLFSGNSSIKQFTETPPPPQANMRSGLMSNYRQFQEKASLDSLKHLVDGVTRGSEFGVNFSKAISDNTTARSTTQSSSSGQKVTDDVNEVPTHSPGMPYGISGHHASQQQQQQSLAGHHQLQRSQSDQQQQHPVQLSPVHSGASAAGGHLGVRHSPAMASPSQPSILQSALSPGNPRMTSPQQGLPQISRIPSPKFTDPPLGSRNAITDWALQNNARPASTRGRGAGRGGTGKRGRPRNIDRSASMPAGTPAGDTFPKRKRGRPKKVPNSPVNPHFSGVMRNTMANTGQQMQQPIPQMSTGFPSGQMNASHQQFHMSGQDSRIQPNNRDWSHQPSFQELLEGDASDLLAEFNTNFPTSQMNQSVNDQGIENPQLRQDMHRQNSLQSFNTEYFTNPHERYDPNSSARTSVDTFPDPVVNSNQPSVGRLEQTSALQGQYPDLSQRAHGASQQISQLSQFGQHLNLQIQPENQHYFQNQSQTDQSFQGLLNGDQDGQGFHLSQAMDLSEPQEFDAGSESTMGRALYETTVDTSQLVPEQTMIHTYNVQRQRTMSEPVNEAFMNKPLQPRKYDKQQISDNLNEKPLHVSGFNVAKDIMELIKYRQRSLIPQPSPFYKYKFPVPSPQLKGIKFRIDEEERSGCQLKEVRMHPKDARKYSLLKIGTEVVKLQNLSDEHVEQIQEQLKLCQEVAGVPPPLREVKVADIPAANKSLIADLLSAEDSPLSKSQVFPQGGHHFNSQLPMSEVNQHLNPHLQRSEVDRHLNPKLQTSEVDQHLNPQLQQENQQGQCSENQQGENNDVANAQLKNGDDESGDKSRKQKRTPTSQRKQNSMFGRNISSVPHLKKYRQGFQYFGKGIVGRGSHTPHLKVRQNNPGLPKEFEDNGDIVIKDVSLTEASDGTLTPIKSRTPIAGRSPAHCGGVPNAEAESELSDYGMDLNQSGNSQIFNEIGVLNDDVAVENNSEAENSGEDVDIADGCDKDNCEEKVDINKEAKNESQDSVEEPIDDIVDIKTELNLDSDSCEKISVGDGRFGVKEENDLPIKCGNTLSDFNITSDKDNDDFNLVLSVKNSLVAKALNSRKNERNASYDERDGVYPEHGVLKKEKLILDKVISRSRSSSMGSVSSMSRSRRNSLISGEESAMDTVSSRSSKRRKSSDNSDSNKTGSKRSKRVLSSNSATSSRRGSRCSSVEKGAGDKKKTKCKSKKSNYRYDSDSDGIPGVDYIVTNKFKGQKELRVVVNKLDVGNLDENSMHESKLNGYNKCKQNKDLVESVNENLDGVKSERTCNKAVTGFSAEFEKFLAAKQKFTIETDSDTEDNDTSEKNSDNDKEKSVTVNQDNPSTLDNSTSSSAVVILDTKNNQTLVIEEVESSDEGHTNRRSVCQSRKQADRPDLHINSGIKDISSSSGEESELESVKVAFGSRSLENFNKKKKKTPNKKHDGRAFVTKRRKRTKSSRPTKLMCTLSVLHDATMEKLTSQKFSDIDTSSSNQSPMKSRDTASDSDSSFRPFVTLPDYETYNDRSDDHQAVFEDTMYKLAYLSPPPPDKDCDSPPRPLTPADLIQFGATLDLKNSSRNLEQKVEQNGQNLVEVREQKLSITDILKNMHEGDTKDASQADDRNVTAPGTPSKIAIAKTTNITLQDIKSFCQAEIENEMNNDLSSPVLECISNEHYQKTEPDNEVCDMDVVNNTPPDLGPPVLVEEKQDERKLDDSSPPPYLTPNRQISASDEENENSEEESDAEIKSGLNYSGKGRAPPFLIPCRSPRVSGMSPRGYSSPRVAKLSECDTLEFSRTGEFESSKMRLGRSPGACSSVGSINVIHSEEFSDISDENDLDDEGHSYRHRQRSGNHVRRHVSHDPSADLFDLPDNSEAERQKHDIHEKERKLREIKEFEQRMRKKGDENRNNIFDIMNSEQSHETSKKTQHGDLNGHIQSYSNDFSFHNNQAVSQSVLSDSSVIKRLKMYRAQTGRELDLKRISSNLFSSNVTAKRGNNASYDAMNCSANLLNGGLFHGNLENQKTHRNGEYHRSLSQSDAKDEQIQSLTHVNGFVEQKQDPRELFHHRGNSQIGLVNSVPYHRSNSFDNCRTGNNSSNPSIKDLSGHSRDLFESSSEVTSAHKGFSSLRFCRSLSDSSARSEYSIVHSHRVNESILKCVNNLAQRSSPTKTCASQVNGDHDVPFVSYGSGEGRKKSNQGGKAQQSSSSNTAQSGNQRLGSSQESSELGSNDRGQGYLTKPRVEEEGGHICHVITPTIPPPSRESIQESANLHGLSAVRHINAFYGNHRDVPEKPREGGGRVIKIPSSLVSELEEFEPTCPSVQGLRHWREAACSTSQLSFSQTGAQDLLQKLQQEPALKYAITGDQSVIITPCLLPPSMKSIKLWNKGRQLYTDIKHKKNEIKDSNHANGKQISEVKTKKQLELKDTEKSQTQEKKKGSYRLNMFTGKREWNSQSDSISPQSSQEGERNKDTNKRNKMDTQEYQQAKKAGNQYTPESKKAKTDNFTPIKPPAVEKSAETPESSQPTDEHSQTEDTNILHSTPMLRRQSTDLFESEYTPIAGSREPELSQDDSKDERECQGEFVTPKRIRPLRRLSTNTETTLRRAILSTQMKQQYGTPSLQRRDTSQIEGPSLKNSFGFRHSQQNLQDAKALHEFQYLTILSVEVHAESRGDLMPDPEHDPLIAIFYSIFNDVPAERGTRQETGVLIVHPESANQQSGDLASTNQKESNQMGSSHKPQAGSSTDQKQSAPSNKTSPGIKDSDPKKYEMTLLEKSGFLGVKVTYVQDEMELLTTFIDLVLNWDADILVGWEIQQLSWGYLLQRASTLGRNLSQALSRLPDARQASHHSAKKDEYGADHMSEIHIAGRITLNLWRLLRHEVTLNIYSFENVAFHVLHRRIPLYPFRSLTSWFKHRTHLHRWKVLSHYMTRAKANLELLDQLDVVGRTSEFARVFGIEFYHVLSRGSQYRVESMMLRVAKPMNYIPVSPSVHQRARMKAPECIALTLEPESRFYTDPVVVVDFQSLYPSIMIAYNYCFSTCLGRLNCLNKAHEGAIDFGCTSLSLDPAVIKKLSGKVSVSPNGVVFCTQEVKRGVISVMVEEILKTRLMVKKAMGNYKGDKTLSRMLNARQLGLKLIANVTYGYTAANYSGRMPCIEVADSIVRKARETLERSIKLVEETPRWRAKVVYGDTDSMFILLKGRSKEEAFKIGQEIARTVTEMFPKPIKLKFEKVYLPCVLQTKKRYVGFMYETPDQKEPVYDAKGIETVRRDTCSAVSKILERSIKVLFTQRDVSEVKAYVLQQCQRVMEGNVSLKDFIFAKEYRGMSGYKPGACVPALEIAKKKVRSDRRSEPRVGERVPYLIVYGSPGLPLIQLVRTPGEVLADPALRLNATYYITKQILPPLGRFLSLLGVDVFSWYQEMPHSAGKVSTHTIGTEQKKGTISQYFATSSCPVCETQTKTPICRNCMSDPQLVCVTLNERITRWERVYTHVLQVCGTCIGSQEVGTINACVSLDCPILHRRSRAANDISRAQSYRDILNKVFT
ncbi:uncharacterized protein LOC128236972 isoform X1 [Mya arenaria]|uniref:uncharacterized protein LOC128236972 isoform X1 n=1 Tax=Mya arenaria TaxID=6604 RepID=UPI0022E47480|nr:uncharacterized protein LOC128236972 isoform X1 [Mya arenaria]